MLWNKNEMLFAFSAKVHNEMTIFWTIYPKIEVEFNENTIFIQKYEANGNYKIFVLAKFSIFAFGKHHESNPQKLNFGSSLLCCEGLTHARGTSQRYCFSAITGPLFSPCHLFKFLSSFHHSALYGSALSPAPSLIGTVETWTAVKSDSIETVKEAHVCWLESSDFHVFWERDPPEYECTKRF
jgi:hypothetical protein